MKNKIIKTLCIIVAVVLTVIIVLIGSFIYVTDYRISDIDASVSPDGKYELIYQNIGEPDFPYGYAHVRLILKCGQETITEHRFDVADDGGSPTAEQWNVDWENSCVRVTVSGEEQPDYLYILYFDGTVKSKEAKNSPEKE